MVGWLSILAILLPFVCVCLGFFFFLPSVLLPPPLPVSCYIQTLHAVGGGGCRRRSGQDISVWSRWLIWHLVAWREPLWQREKKRWLPAKLRGPKAAPRIKVTLTKIFYAQMKVHYKSESKRSDRSAPPHPWLPPWNTSWSNLPQIRFWRCAGSLPCLQDAMNNNLRLKS